MTSATIERFLQAAGWGMAERAPIAGDASSRRYERIGQPGRTAVLMHAPVSAEADRSAFDAFVHVARYLKNNGFSAPELYHMDPDNGLILMEDLGECSLSKRLSSGQGDLSYRLAGEVSFELAKLDLPGWIARADTDDQVAMVNLTFDQIPQVEDLAAETRAELRAALEVHAAGGLVLSVRDYHADNLMWLPQRTGLSRIGVLDFQDAVALPEGYDLASLVDDPRRDVPAALRDDLIAAFAPRRGASLVSARARIDTLSLLRNLRIIGIFNRLSGQGKPSYRAFLPRTMALVARAAQNPALDHLRSPIDETLRRVASWVTGDHP